MNNGKITMEVGDHRISFDMYEAMRYPHKNYSLSCVDSIGITYSVVEDQNFYLHSNISLMSNTTSLEEGSLTDIASTSHVHEVVVELGNHI